MILKQQIMIWRGEKLYEEMKISVILLLVPTGSIHGHTKERDGHIGLFRVCSLEEFLG